MDEGVGKRKLKERFSVNRLSKVITIGIYASVFSFLVSQSFAQQIESPAYSYGVAASVSVGQIVVTEYNYETDEEVDTAYLINEKTEFKNAHSVQDIAVGDSVDIVYTITDGKKIAQSISIDKASSDDDDPDAQDQETQGPSET